MDVKSFKMCLKDLVKKKEKRCKSDWLLRVSVCSGQPGSRKSRRRRSSSSRQRRRRGRRRTWVRVPLRWAADAERRPELTCFLSLTLSPSVRSQRATGIGRLMVNIVEGIELKPCRSHGTETPPLLPVTFKSVSLLLWVILLSYRSCVCPGKSNPYCEVTMGSQCHITKTLQVWSLVIFFHISCG